MFKKFPSWIIVGLFLIALGFAMGKPSQVQAVTSENVYEKELPIADFDSGNIKRDPTWWTFDRIQTVFKEAQDEKNGLYYLEVTGKAENYYVGGLGTYLGKDASDFDTLTALVKGHGPNSGIVKFQIFDDDHHSHKLDLDNASKPLYDDQFEYKLPVTWEGWRTIEIPLSHFVLANPGIGDGIMNLDQKNGSGGLLQFQMVLLATTEKGSINIGLDNIKLAQKSE